ncbi:MAG: methyltransferase domain-containing protein [Streptomyces turgidiscabies]|nr:methyltransferase domain-containing protein [Streptomyces turgidiscabies]
MRTSELRTQTAHTAASSEEFYSARGAAAIMRAAHFPDEILFFLQMESLVTLGAAARHGCDALVEFGCYDGRALEVARAAGVDYLGVDVNDSAIAALRQRISDEALEGQAETIIGNVLKKETWAYKLPGVRPLYLLPFNLIGNFPEPVEVLRSLRSAGGTAVVSVFNEAPWTTEVRREYYAACGIETLERNEGSHGGVLFRGADGFRSHSFSAEGVSSLLRACGALALEETANRYGRCITVRFP